MLDQAANSRAEAPPAPGDGQWSVRATGWGTWIFERPRIRMEVEQGRNPRRGGRKERGKAIHVGVSEGPGCRKEMTPVGHGADREGHAVIRNLG